MESHASRDTRPPRPARQPRSESANLSGPTAANSVNVVTSIIGERLKRRLDAEGAQPIPLFEVPDDVA